MRHFILSLSVRTWLITSALRARLMLGLSTLLATTALPAYANDGIFGMLDKVAGDADASKKGLLQLAGFGGVGMVILGIVLWVAKKKNPQITWGWILTALGAGFVLIAIDQFIKKGQSTLNLNPVDI